MGVLVPRNTVDRDPSAAADQSASDEVAAAAPAPTGELTEEWFDGNLGVRKDPRLDRERPILDAATASGQAPKVTGGQELLGSARGAGASREGRQ
jgi:hypothetical protein